MKVSIRTAYRIVKKVEDPEYDPIFIPQYQEEGSEEWHIFKVRINGRSGGYNTVHFFVLSEAIDYIERQKAQGYVVVHYDDLIDCWTENPPEEL